MIRFRISLAVAAMLGTSLIAVADTHLALAAEFIVTNLDDDGDGSLRDRIMDANATGGLDTITFADGLNGTIEIASPLDVTDPLDIVGPGAETITIDGAEQHQILRSSADLFVEALTFSRGVAAGSGGAVWVGSGNDLVVRSAVFEGNRSDSNGGAIAVVNGDISTIDATFNDNQAVLGGAVWSTGTADIGASTFNDNQAELGGALHLDGTTSIDDSTFESNSVVDGGGAAHLIGNAAEINSSTFRTNSALSGGAISLDVDLTATDSVFDANRGDTGGAMWASLGTDVVARSVEWSDNTAAGDGGAVFALGNLEFVDNVFDNNVAGMSGGAIRHNSKNLDMSTSVMRSNQATNGNGGAVFSLGDVRVIASSLRDNQASDGGAIYNDSEITDELSILYSTVADNAATDDGGGAYFAGGDLDIFGSTFVANSADESGGGFFVFEEDPEDFGVWFTTVVDNVAGLGGGAYFGTSVAIDDSIIASNSAVTGPDLFGPAVVNTSLIGDETDATIVGKDNLSGDPKLRPLDNYGGVTDVMVPHADSPVIDAGEPDELLVVGFDQRFLPRVVGTAPDMGSVELTAHDRAVWTPTTPARLLDTRPSKSTADGLFAGDGRRQAGSTLMLDVSRRGGVPADAGAAVVNLTAVNPAGIGFVTVWDCRDAQPNASSLNFTGGVNLGNEIVARLSVDGQLCIFTSAATDLTVDVVGHLSTTGPFTPIDPARFVDTRTSQDTIDGRFAADGKRLAGSELRVAIGGRGEVPPDAQAATINVTAIGAEATGFLTVHACGDSLPNASSLNYVAGVNRGNEVTVSLDEDGFVCVFTSAAAHLTVDVVGWLPAPLLPEGLGFEFNALERAPLEIDLEPTMPSRLLDTRATGATIDGIGQAGGLRSAAHITEVQVGDRAGVATGATTAVVNVTAVGAQAEGFLTLYRCGEPRPDTSNLNYVAGINGGNEVTLGLELRNDGGPSRICIFNSSPTHVTVDVTGYSTM